MNTQHDLNELIVYIIDIHVIHVIVNLYVILCLHNEMGRATQEATVLV